MKLSMDGFKNRVRMVYDSKLGMPVDDPEFAIFVLLTGEKELSKQVIAAKGYIGVTLADGDTPVSIEGPEVGVDTDGHGYVAFLIKPPKGYVIANEKAAFYLYYGEVGK